MGPECMEAAIDQHAHAEPAGPPCDPGHFCVRIEGPGGSMCACLRNHVFDVLT